jgi:hypothetical protein
MTEDGKGQSCLFDNPTLLHALEHLVHSCLFCQGESPWGFANWSSLSRIYMVVHSVGPSVVIAVHSKDVTMLSEELF